MSLFDKLMAVDDSAINEKRTQKVHSERLSALFGTKTEITIEALPYRRVSKIMDAALKDNGRLDPDRAVDARCHLIRLSVTEIPWGDERLQKKFRASDPKDLAEKCNLFPEDDVEDQHRDKTDHQGCKQLTVVRGE